MDRSPRRKWRVLSTIMLIKLTKRCRGERKKTAMRGKGKRKERRRKAMRIWSSKRGLSPSTHTHACSEDTC
jgi:hypothetical protein